MSAPTPYTTQQTLPRGSKVTESDDPAVQLCHGCDGCEGQYTRSSKMGIFSVSDDSDALEFANGSEPSAATLTRFLEIETRKRDRTLSKDARQAARSLAEIILNRWCERRKENEKTRPSRKRNACDMLSETIDMSSPASTQSDLPNDLGRGTIVSSRPGFHTVVVDSSNNTLEVPEDEYNKWYSLYERKSDVESSIDTRLANRARAKNMMDNWCKRRKRAKKTVGSCAGEVPVDDDGYAAAMALMGLSYVS
ncbi:hypothetical protein AG1IA_01501 [Rhizoctonia solani AG-1 IA]|uniref:Uncharacterized protein n=1 Tax=Thanatephorus cucumeris (strain AG1-IA) TaxID=983506 RepID=L8X5U8_THACA|nr:hypothetical protein AG1IA_01501 [Rhizoctonia solani AG-1 IA]